MEQAQLQRAVLDVAALTRNAMAISEALIAGDWAEARFLSRVIAADAAILGLMDVYTAAITVSEQLGVAGSPPSSAYAQAVLALSEALASALRALT